MPKHQNLHWQATSSFWLLQMKRGEHNEGHKTGLLGVPPSASTGCLCQQPGDLTGIPVCLRRTSVVREASSRSNMGGPYPRVFSFLRPGGVNSELDAKSRLRIFCLALMVFLKF